MNKLKEEIFMNDVRIIFIGTPEFACPILQTLVDEGYNVVAAVCQPDRPTGRKQVITPTPVHALADKLNIPVLQPEKLRAEYQSVLDYEPDLIVTAAYGQIVPEVILKAPRYGCLNIHPSLLPKYRGGAPIHHAVWAGDEKTGVCLMEMVKAMDAGRVYARTEVPIGPDETTSEMYEKLQEASCALVKESLPLYLEGKLEGEPQDESKVVLARNISKEDEMVHFADEDIHQVYNHIRALTDWPLAYGMLDGKRMKFIKVRKQVCETEETPGTVLGFRDHAMEIACRGGILRVLELQPEGKSRMSADAFANGAGRNIPGHVFE